MVYKVSQNAERMWLLLQRDSGSVAVCNWYLPPGDSLEEIESLRQELDDVASIAESVILTGDLNVHHKSWLRFSSRDSSRGKLLKEVCSSYGLVQLVDQSTRGEYLLDLVLCDSPATVQVQVRSKIADHNCILVKVPDVVETRTFEPRVVWKLDDANWGAIETHLRDFDWRVLREGTVDDALDVFESTLRQQMLEHIPRFSKPIVKSTLP